MQRHGTHASGSIVCESQCPALLFSSLLFSLPRQKAMSARRGMPEQEKKHGQRQDRAGSQEGAGGDKEEGHTKKERVGRTTSQFADRLAAGTDHCALTRRAWSPLSLVCPFSHVVCRIAHAQSNTGSTAFLCGCQWRCSFEWIWRRYQQRRWRLGHAARLRSVCRLPRTSQPATSSSSGNWSTAVQSRCAACQRNCERRVCLRRGGGFGGFPSEFRY